LSGTQVGIIGPGRAGLGLGLALARAGHQVAVHGRAKKRVPAPLTLTTGDGDSAPPWIGDVDVVILAVRDDAIRPLAESLKSHRVIKEKHVVLHLSGVQGQEALGALVTSHAALGSLHPLQAIADPAGAPERLRGAWAAVEGMPRAVETAERLARDVGMRPWRLTAKTKVVYHAGAVFASNYLVVVLAVAQRLVRHAGLSDMDAWEALTPLIEGTFDNLRRDGPVDALTGPIVRADDATIAKHLQSLAFDDAMLYRVLGRAALELAQKRGMDEETATRISGALAIDLPPVLRPAPKT
jgi:predicted short-subunit dehydrogenase-like oxidoreductase (DUF2520 family)